MHVKIIIEDKEIKQSVNGNTNTVYINPMNALFFVLKKFQIDRINLNKSF